jgi:signal transduction histidine kinase
MREVEREKRVLNHQRLLAIPVIWQQRLIAAVVIELSRWRIGVGRTLRIFEGIAREVAPSLENARLYNSMQQQRNLLEAVLMGAPEPIVLASPSLQPIQSNPAFDSFLGQPYTPTVSLRTQLTHAGLSPELVQELQRRFSDSSINEHQFEVSIRNKTYRLRAARLQDGRWVLVLSDVSSLAELSQLKTQMIRMASHDLKKPLSRIVGYSSLILDTDSGQTLTDQNQEYITHIAEAGQEMAQIISEILSIEQLRTRNIERKPVLLATVLREVVERYAPDYELKSQNVTLQIDDEDVQVSGDDLLLGQLIANLLDNAIKYTPNHGSVTLLMRRTETMVRIEVTDTGYGIPESAQSQIFQEFYRVRTRETVGISGTGLGLSLAKAIVERHDGTIAFTSMPSQGTSFVVSLPIIMERSHE